MLEIFVYYSDAIQRIALYLLVALVVYMWVAKDYFRSYVMENRQVLQSDPTTLPIVVFYDKLYEPGNNTSFLSAFIEMLYAIVREVFMQLMKPLYAIGKMYIRMFEVFREIINTIRKQIMMLRQVLTNIFRDIYNRLEVGMASINFLFFKLRDTMKRIYATSKMMTYVAQHTINFLEAMMGSDIGRLGRLIGDNGIAISVLGAPAGLGGPWWSGANAFPACFDPNTRTYVQSPNYRHINQTLYMHQVELGHRLVHVKDDSVHTVVATIRFRPNLIRYTSTRHIPSLYCMYNIGGIVVSGSHSIHLSDSSIRRVSNDDRSELLKEYTPSSLTHGIQSFITDTGIIPCSSQVLFRDYLDTHSPDFHARLRRETDMALNGVSSDTTLSNEYYMKCADTYTGWCTVAGVDSQWTMKNGSDDIYATIQIAPGQLDMYEISGVNGLLFSGNAWIATHGTMSVEWILVSRHPDARFIGRNDGTANHYIMRTNVVEWTGVDGRMVRIRDFLEMSGVEFLEEQCNALEEFGFLE